MDLKKGDKVWVELFDYRGRKQEPIETEITKIGKKYLYVQVEWCEYKFYCDTLKVVDSFGSAVLYMSKKEYDDAKLYETLLAKVKNVFGSYGSARHITLVQLQQIDKILTPTP